MARIVCQVVHTPGRVSFLWSEGELSFEPYHLEGDARDRFLQSSKTARELLTRCVGDPGDAKAAKELAQAGSDLYRSLFNFADPECRPASAVFDWFNDLDAKGKIDSLEMLSNAPGRTPWNVLFGGEPNDFGPKSWGEFWGQRYALAVGRRVNPLRVAPALPKPSILLAIDPQLEHAAKSKGLAARFGTGPVRKAWSGKELFEAVQEEAPDLLVLVGRVDQGMIGLGEDWVRPDDLAQWLTQSKSGNPYPLVLAAASGPATAAGTWECFLGSSVFALPGLITSEVPVAADQVDDALAQALGQILETKQSVAVVLQHLRRQLGPVGLALSAFCPATLRVDENGPVEDDFGPPILPLPETPFHPLQPLEREDRGLFVGRDHQVIRCAGLLDQIGTQGLLLHGGMGVGKTSFLRAGLVPHLEEEALGFYALRDRTPEKDAEPLAEMDHAVLSIRCTHDPVAQIAQALFGFLAQPWSYQTPAGATVEVDLLAQAKQAIRGAAPSTAIKEEGTNVPQDEFEGGELTPLEVRRALEADPDLLARLLDQLTRQLPFEVIITLEQGEDLVVDTTSEDKKLVRQAGLEMLTRLIQSPARCKVIVTLRSDFFGSVLEALPKGKDRGAWREFLLPDLTAEELEEVLLRPTQDGAIPYSEDIPAQKYRFSLEGDLAETLVKEILQTAKEQQVQPLALVHSLGQKMVVRARQGGRSVVNAFDLKLCRPVENLPGQLVEAKVQEIKISWVGRLAFRQLLNKMAGKQANGTTTRPLHTPENLKSIWQAPTLRFFPWMSIFAFVVVAVLNYFSLGWRPITILGIVAITGTVCWVEYLLHRSRLARVQPELEPALQGALRTKPPLLELHQTILDGNKSVYLSLAGDSVSQASVRSMAAHEKADYAWSRVIDVMWVMVPLLFLAAAITFFFTRMASGGGAEIPENVKEAIKEIQEENKELSTRLREMQFQSRRPAYQGALSQAQAALQSGNVLLARQMLLSQQGEKVDEKNYEDLRGFEWFYLWRLMHQETRGLLGHEAPVGDVVVTTDGKTIASASLDGSVKLWDLDKGTLRATLLGHKAPSWAVAVTPDGKTVAAGGADGSILVWDISGVKEGPDTLKKEKTRLSGHKGSVSSLAFGSDNLLVSGGQDQLVILWDVVKGDKKTELKEHTGAVNVVRFAPDGKTLVSGGSDGKVVVWDSAGVKKNPIATPLAEITAVAFGPEDGSLLVGGRLSTLATPDCGVLILGLEKGDLKKSWAVPDVKAMAYQKKTNQLITSGTDHQMHVWDVAAGKKVRTILGHMGWVNALALTPDQATLVTGSYDATIKTWPVSGDTFPDLVPLPAAGKAVAFMSGDKVLAVADAKGAVHLLDPSTGQPLTKPLEGYEGTVGAVAFGGDGKTNRLAVGITTKDEGRIEVYEVTLDPKQGLNAKITHTLKGAGKAVTALAFSENGVSLISGSSDGKGYLWDPATGKLTKALVAHGAAITCVASDGGLSFLMGDLAGSVSLWNARNGDKQRGPMSVLQGPIFAAGFFERDTGIVTIGEDRQMHAFDWKEPQGQLVASRRFTPQESHVLAISPKWVKGLKGEMASLAVVGCEDHTIKLVDLRGDKGRPSLRDRFTLTGHTAPVRALAVSSDGLTIASTGPDGTLRFWRSTTPEKALSQQQQ